MSFFTINQDAQIFNDNQECLNNQYLAAQAELPTKKEETENNNHSTNAPTSEPPLTEEKSKKESLNWANPRFTMSSFQLYETKTVKFKTIMHKTLCFLFYLF
jgi:hypothetical protein